MSSSYCRICAELKPLVEQTNLQTDEEMCQKVVNKLSRFNIMMDFHDNILPKTVCLICVGSLEQAFTFITAVEQAQVYLRNFIIIDHDKNNLCEKSDIRKDVLDETEEYISNPMDFNNDNSNNSEESESKEKINTFLDSSHINVDIEEYNTQYDNKINENMNIKQEHVELNNVEDITEISKPLHLSNGIKNQDDIYINDTNITISLPINKVKNVPIEYSGKRNFPKQWHGKVLSEEFINKQFERLKVVPIQHIRTTWMDYSWKCSHCETLFPTVEELQKHSIKYHNVCNAYKCTECKWRKQRLNAFIKHVRSHRKCLHYSCYKCFEKFPKHTETRLHKIEIHENSDYICLGCNNTFSSKDDLKKHVGKYYDNLSKHRHKDKKREHVCDICGKSFFTKPDLKNHMLTHDSERVLPQCEICKATFKSEYTLRYHSSIHSGIKPYSCDICGKGFRTKSTIIGHMKSHSDILPFSCSVCSKKFRTSTNLKNHMRQHTGEKPFACEVCSRVFTNLSNRNKHMRRIHGIEIVKKRRLEETSPDLAEEVLSKFNRKSRKLKAESTTY